ncbi:MAG: Rid family detoxifying hydrolase, partial [Candidatus Woesearchaeota archaeon]
MNTINTQNAPKPVGPYSQAIEHNGFLFISGQIAINPKTQKFDANSSLIDQTKQVLANITAILHEAKCTTQNIVKVEIFLTNISSFAEVNKLYEEFLEGHFPARQTVEVSALPLNAQIEISCIAVLNQ